MSIIRYAAQFHKGLGWCIWDEDDDEEVDEDNDNEEEHDDYSDNYVPPPSHGTSHDSFEEMWRQLDQHDDWLSDEDSQEQALYKTQEDPPASKFIFE